MKRLHIFRAGRRTAMSGATITFSEADLAASASAYDPKLHEAPLVLGHPKTDGPAQGWVSSLSASDVDLFATPRAVDAQFAESVQAERYKKISAAFYPPDHPSNPVPGVYYLRHVGFLGATPPSVKGLAPVEFADDGEGLVEIEFGDWTDGAVGRALRGLREWFIGKFGLEEADKALPGWTADALIEASMTPDTSLTNPAFADATPTPLPNPLPQGQRESEAQELPTMTPEEIKAAQDQLAADKAAQDAAFAERETRIASREAAAARQDAVEFADELVEQGRVPPAQKNRVVELLHAVRGVATELEFAEGDVTVKAKPDAALKDFLKSLPVQIEYAEVSGKNKPAPADIGDAKALADSALEYADAERKKGRTISIAQAMTHVTQKAV
ncbi:MAG: peptidase [Panacagrimonas sp.]